MQIAIIAASLPLSTRPQPERGNYAVILTSGPEDGGKRATLALAAACTAQALDLNTIVFLVADGVHWGYHGHAEGVHAPGFPALADLMESFFESGGQVFVSYRGGRLCDLLKFNRPQSKPTGPTNRRR